MEYIKKALNMCCKNCCAKRKSSEDSGVRIILPSNKTFASRSGSSIRTTTFTYLAQPNFYIPMSDDKFIPSPPSNRRKQSAPPILTQMVPVQPFAAYSPTNEKMHSSAHEPIIHIEEHSNEPVSDNHNNNHPSLVDTSIYKSTESVCSSHGTLSPSTRPKYNNKRLSVAQLASHSRRSSMSSFDISRDEVDSDMYESSELLHDVSSNGKLCYSVSYDSDFEQLTVTIISARNLWNPEQNCIVTDSFVKVSIFPPLKKKVTKTATAVQHGSSSPTYDETIAMDGVAQYMLSQHVIKLTVFAIDKLSKRRKLGLVNHQFCDFQADNQGKKIWSHIYPDGEVCFAFSML